MTIRGIGAVKAGDGGVKFRAEWPELDAENWAWMKENRVDAATGRILPAADGESAKCSPEVMALKRGPGGSVGGLGDAGRAAREAGQGWLGRHKVMVVVFAVLGWALASRWVASGDSGVS